LPAINLDGLKFRLPYFCAKYVFFAIFFPFFRSFKFQVFGLVNQGLKNVTEQNGINGIVSETERNETENI
jgi:hypothetical protein